MSHFLKQIFKPSAGPSRTPPGPSYTTYDFSPEPSHSGNKLHRRHPEREHLHTLEDLTSDHEDLVLGDHERSLPLANLTDVLHNLQIGQSQKRNKLVKSWDGKGKGKGKAKAREATLVSETESSRRRSGREWTQAVNACTEALNIAEKILAEGGSGRASNILIRIIDLLEAQRDELFDLRGYAEGHGIPTLQTLSDIYTKASSALSAVQFASHSTSISTLQTLFQVLSEGPDYLIDVTIIEAIIWQAEVIDAQFGSEVREVLDNAVAEQNNLVTFRRAAESIIAIASALPRDELDDAFAREAYRAIGLLVKQLQARVDSTRRGTPVSSDHERRISIAPSPVIDSPAYSQTPSPIGIDSPISSPIVSPTVSDAEDSNYEALDTESLQRRYGTGIKSPSSRPTSYSPSPASPVSPASSDSESVWEYRGHLVTRSALELLLVQEEQKKLLAHADSSGQWAGEVSWDDLRNAWIPRWTEKLRPEDLAEGEVPSTNPADFKVKEKDQWGNKIEWKNGRMFYVEEGDPTFELPE